MRLDIFIKGENIDLCIPTKEFAENSNWYSWFNNSRTTRYLEQGVFPNTVANQLVFYENESKSGKRLMLIISDREKYIGTVSLSFINFQMRTADIALVIGEQSSKTNISHLFALESMARLIEHGFTKLGLIRISADQHIELHTWQQKLELLGFKVEGIKQHSIVKGIEVNDGISISVINEDFLFLKKTRGYYWDSGIKMEKRMELLPADSFLHQLQEFYNTRREDYYRQLFDL